MRHHKVVVTDAGGTPLYCMGWSKNNPVKLDKNDSLIQMHLSNYWEYSGEDEGLDYSYVDRYQLIIYENLEEYSYHTARMVLRHNPEMKIAFTDPNAALFFAGNVLRPAFALQPGRGLQFPACYPGPEFQHEFCQAKSWN